ncbi:hypothetical protein HG535_0C04160 [Zygotorulaspora mrakii]|uniref:Uncharacterized protein n=1 Tax=Zygotorulaspora mrakii TaxID=42260 RepID=A0A7H9B2S0_ZYGMR|nr:uncharacterized protein HG535_0C04160 [Zygotorulaspora mrakii]QLG72062.1 hypothetical protein HG535_0C04160 [Zygotorulaspora mrakii]
MRQRSSHLPKTFLGCLPLYIGVDISLGVTIFNKCSGAYGILALFTGHPLEFMQWVMYLWSIATLCVYAQGLFQKHRPKLLTFSQIFVTFSIDTILTCLFTLWFTHSWYSLEGSSKENSSTGTSDGIQEANQGASQAVEYGATLFITLVSLISKLYFNFLLASYVQELLLHPKYMVDQDDVEQDLKHQRPWKRWWIKSQKICYKFSKNLLA